MASFRGLSIDQIRQNRDMILMDDEHVVIKPSPRPQQSHTHRASLPSKPEHTPRNNLWL